MKKDLIQLAALGLSAGLCLSGHSGAPQLPTEIAMSSSKEVGDMEVDENSNETQPGNSGGKTEPKNGYGSPNGNPPKQKAPQKGNGNASCGGPQGCGSTSNGAKKNTNASDSKNSIEKKRKSAAQKVVQGE